MLDIIVTAESIILFKQKLSEYFLKTHADNCKICFNFKIINDILTYSVSKISRL